MRQFSRELTPVLLERASQYPVVTVTGPRQSGKTTLCKQAFPALPYANLEQPDTREFARSDPRGFLQQYTSGCILDEIQQVPELLSWIQVQVDRSEQKGQFILTGSHQLDLNREISQSLAGRTALLKLLPLSLAELGNKKIDWHIYSGGYPRIHRDKLVPSVALADYFETYVQRDLRALIQIRNLPQFERFVRLAAGRVGQVLNMQSLAVDAGISGHTAREWLSLLEASFIIFTLPPWFANLNKRLVKSPKLYFYDTGLAAWLLNIREEAHLQSHPLRGNLFENLMVLEVMKHYYHHGEKPPAYYYRDSNGTEIDLLLESSNSLALLEIKSGSTIANDMLKPLLRVQHLLGERVTKAHVIYGGDENQQRQSCGIVSWRNSAAIFE